MSKMIKRYDASAGREVHHKGETKTTGFTVVVQQLGMMVLSAFVLTLFLPFQVGTEDSAVSRHETQQLTLVTIKTFVLTYALPPARGLSYLIPGLCVEAGEIAEQVRQGDSETR